MTKTLKEMEIKRISVRKHGVPMWVYEYKGKLYASKKYAVGIYEKDKK